ncbi:hypothetical protein FB559_0255 [Actinoallomurus bryophytorum]|uniref:Uncharacterized protein n=1 Tax=Actinoallomurus bryophytorum TaxID=1490222 RepID=A0A543CCF1_9ACTN|nr:hypothetical protein FB559_0255 [Actinoallomurus bryophytorum]
MSSPWLEIMYLRYQEAQAECDDAEDAPEDDPKPPPP